MSGCRLGNFNDQDTPSEYYNFLNDDDDYVNNFPGTLVDSALTDNKGVEHSVMPNNEINDEIITIDADDRLASYIETLQKTIL